MRALFELKLLDQSGKERHKVQTHRPIRPPPQTHNQPPQAYINPKQPPQTSTNTTITTVTQNQPQPPAIAHPQPPTIAQPRIRSLTPSLVSHLQSLTPLLISKQPPSATHKSATIPTTKNQSKKGNPSNPTPPSLHYTPPPLVNLPPKK